ncbi:MAG: TonB-dependent receptor, partial [Bacteroidota bacterium]
KQVALFSDTPASNKDNIQQPQSVTGTITDEDGNPMPGVNIVIKGTTQGTISDADGKYGINVDDPGATLEFSFIGMFAQEVQVVNQTEINVTMTRDVLGLEELVVIGYGTQKKTNNTGAISMVTEESLKNISHSSVSQLIQGKVSGVNIIKTNGRPGAGSHINIRGINTFGDNSPLIVIDGQIVESGLDNLDPNEIESVNVLKDAGSAAIYGSRAANGVILVTTKSGKAGTGQLEVNLYTGMQKLITHMTLMTAEEYVMMIDEARSNRNIVYNGTLEPYYPEGPDAWKGKGTDWVDEMFRTAPVTSANMAVTGGSEKVKYRVGGTYFTQEGILLNTGFNKASARVNLDAKVTDRLTFGTRISYINSHQYGGIGVMGTILQIPPTVPVYEPDGSPGYGKGEGDGLWYSPKFSQELDDPTTDNNNLIGNMFLEYRILDFLKFRINGGLDHNYSRFQSFTETWNVADRWANTKSSFTDNRSFINNWVNDYLLYFDKEFADAHTVNALAGYSRQFQAYETHNGVAYDFISEDEYNQILNGGTNPEEANATGGRSELALMSYFGRINYSYRDKYLLSLNFRADGSSRFAEENRWGYFPSASAAWVVSNESFFNVSFLNYLKLRGNWGQLGNQSIGGYYPAIPVLAQSYTALGPGGQGDVTRFPQVYQQSFVNRDLRWETTVISNLGIDAGLFNNRLRTTVEYFIKNTKDILRTKVIPNTVGLSPPVVNFAEMRNNGVELELAWKDRVGSDFNYNFGFNLTKLHNEIVKLSEGEDRSLFSSTGFYGTYLNEVGQPMQSFYGYEFDGIYQNQAELDALPSSRAYVGSLKFKDLNGDGEITVDDRKVLGDAVADLLLGFNFSAQYKNFDFSMYWQGDFGRKQYSPRYFQDNWVEHNYVNIWLDRWTGEGSTNEMPMVVWMGTADNVMSSFQLVDVSYLRMKTVSLGYTFDFKKLGSLRAYVAGDNLITLVSKDYVGWDPEMKGPRNNGLAQFGLWGDVYPSAKVFTIGLNLTLK